MKINHNKLFIVTILLISLTSTAHAQIVSTIFGDIDEQNPATLALIEHASVQRLKQIDQSGPLVYFTDQYPKFSRYDHSLGVYALLKRYQVTNEEQIAGLMHDASHTVFSHVADFVFQEHDKQAESYQDSIHDWFLNRMGVADLIKKFHLSLMDISPKNPKFTALEQAYPDMNADRIEYNLHTALLMYDLDQTEIENILRTLVYKDNKWYFTDVLQAKKFAKLSNYYTRTFWGSKQNLSMNIATGTMIKYAMQHKILTADDLHFGIDSEVIAKLQASKDPIIMQLLKIMPNIDSYCATASQDNYDLHIPIKMRGIDPLVMHKGELKRLSEISVDFKNDLQQTADSVNQGTYLKFVGINNTQLLEILRTTIN